MLHPQSCRTQLIDSTHAKMKMASVQRLVRVWTSGDPPTDLLITATLLYMNSWQATTFKLARFHIFFYPAHSFLIQNHTNTLTFSWLYYLFTPPQGEKNYPKNSQCTSQDFQTVIQNTGVANKISNGSILC